MSGMSHDVTEIPGMSNDARKKQSGVSIKLKLGKTNLLVAMKTHLF